MATGTGDGGGCSSSSSIGASSILICAQGRTYGQTNAHIFMSDQTSELWASVSARRALCPLSTISQLLSFYYHYFMDFNFCS